MLGRWKVSTSIKMECTIIQYNCQRSYVAMCELGEIMSEKRAGVALLQEPFFRCKKVCGLPTGIKIFSADDGRAAVVVRDTSLECMLVTECTDDRGVCVWLKGAVGEMYVISV